MSLVDQLVVDDFWFWQRDLSYFEKPKIRFLRQSYFELRSRSGLYGWSTYTNLNAQLGDSLLIPQMTVSELDDDGDELYDHVTLRLKFRTTEIITGVYALLFFEVQFKEQLMITLQTPVLIQFIGPDKMGGLGYSHVGWLSLYQMQPLVQGRKYNEYNVS
ncbi:transmembrane protein 231 [Paragonimus westermani]|uniref:Transmembrane protein 231 n=1 Tax=Paragonimus westermani TaxID=34504 RepID=A0A5J4N8F2_9TREM|nr:transmembrane protein 231 [Paragonimus westermani]